jgi:hypothetical protein
MNIKDTVETAVADIAWLAGFWDADGSIGLKKQGKYLMPFATCTNTSKKAIDNIARILEAAGIEYHIEFHDRSHLHNSSDCWIIRMNSRPRVSKFLSLVKDRLVVKKEQAELTLRWCNLPKFKKQENIPDEYWSIRDKVQSLNSRGRNSLTKP